MAQRGTSRRPPRSQQRAGAQAEIGQATEQTTAQAEIGQATEQTAAQAETGQATEQTAAQAETQQAETQQAETQQAETRPADTGGATTQADGAAVAAVQATPAPVVPTALATPGLRTLAIDIGGTGIKLMLLDGAGRPLGERRRVPTPHPATPDAVLNVIGALLPEEPYDRVSVGFPGVVVDGVVRSAPNLDASFSGFDLQAALVQRTGRPARVLNDAGVQGYGVIEGRGVETLITLGTGMGFALFLDGRYVPNIELAHHPLRRRKTYEEYVGNAARKRVGNRRWRRRVLRVVEQVRRVFNPRVLYLGGGNASKLRFGNKRSGGPPEGVQVTDNGAGLLGGIALWRDGDPVRS